MNNNKCEVYDIIISFVKAYKRNNGPEGSKHYFESEYNNKKIWLWNTGYLLNQILRQIDVPKERLLVSEEALKTWKTLMGDEDINKYYYREKITVKNNGDIQEYKGASSTPTQTRSLNPGDTFIYKDVFHLEHVVPISTIIDKLANLNDDKLDYEHVDKILSEIYVCRMLKSEDRKINEKYKRPNDKEKVIQDIYGKYGIKVLKV